jgi:hypothetical protein
VGAFKAGGGRSAGGRKIELLADALAPVAKIVGPLLVGRIRLVQDFEIEAGGFCRVQRGAVEIQVNERGLGIVRLRISSLRSHF